MYYEQVGAKGRIRGKRIDFVVEDVHQVMERSFASLRMTEGRAQDDRGQGYQTVMFIRILPKVLNIIMEHLDLLREAWNEHFT